MKIKKWFLYVLILFYVISYALCVCLCAIVWVHMCIWGPGDSLRYYSSSTLHLFKRQDLSLARHTYKAQLLARSPRTCLPSSSQGRHYKHAQPWLFNVSSRDWIWVLLLAKHFSNLVISLALILIVILSPFSLLVEKISKCPFATQSRLLPLNARVPRTLNPTLVYCYLWCACVCAWTCLCV